MRCIVDLTEVLGMAARAEAELPGVPRQMLDILTEAADTELATHAYQNRTGDLEAMTFAAPAGATDNECTVEYGARMEYASFVEGRGFSRVTELATEAEAEIHFRLELSADAIVSP